MKLKTSLICLLPLFIRFSKSVIITTSYGKLNGERVGEYHSFKHVPFAKPPIGELRFQKPETADKWKEIRQAKKYGPACMSNSTETSSPQEWIDEDCLHVNIFTSDKCLESKGCAVAVYIHGGDILYDSAVMFNDTFLMDSFVKNDVILVIPGFRLGIFSHFAVDDQSIAPNNVAIYDILKSLDYVQSEIHNFGGNNKKVTMFGHSYGGTIVALLTFSTEINQDLSLFQRAILMSSHQYYDQLEDHIERTQLFAKHANCFIDSKVIKKMTRSEQDKHTMRCLQAKSGMELLRIQRSMEESGYPEYGGLIYRGPLFPNVKQSEFLNSPKEIPILTGCIKTEFDFDPEKIPLAESLDFENPDESETKYRNDLKEGKFDRDNHTDRTQLIMVPTKIRVNKLLDKNIPAYLYEFTYPKHARHTDDLYYIMGVHPFQEDENEIHLKKVYQDMFINFIKYGHPGDGFEISNAEKSSYFDVYWNETTGERPRMRNNFEKKVMDYWLKDMMEYDRKITEEKNKGMKKPNLKFNKRDLVSSETYQASISSLLSFIIIVIFLAGYIVGKCCSSRKDLYIRLDGSNFENVKQLNDNKTS